MLVVQKFGGTSLASTKRIAAAANIVKRQVQKGHKAVVVVSAMAGQTNTLLAHCREFSSLGEYSHITDFVLSSGENISCGLMALALNQLGVKATPLQGWQVPILTSNCSSKALILSAAKEKILSLVEEGITPVVSGFQGISSEGYITTLGRGGSDISAAAIAAGIGADMCDIYTDVPGIHSADPRIIKNALNLSHIDYDNALEMSYQGAKVMHPRSIEIAKAFQLNLRVLSSFERSQETNIGKYMELPEPTSITCNTSVMMCKIKDPNWPSSLSDLALSGIAMHCAAHNEGITTLVLSSTYLSQLEKLASTIKQQNLLTVQEQLTDIAMVSVIGSRLLNDNSIALKTIEVAKQYSLLHFALEHSKIILVTKQDDAISLTRSLHSALITPETISK